MCTMKNITSSALMLILCTWLGPVWSVEVRDLLGSEEVRPALELPVQLNSYDEVMLTPTVIRELASDVPWVVFEPRVFLPRSATLHDRPLELSATGRKLRIASPDLYDVLRFRIYFLTNHNE